MTMKLKPVQMAANMPSFRAFAMMMPHLSHRAGMLPSQKSWAGRNLAWAEGADGAGIKNCRAFASADKFYLDKYVTCASAS